MKKKIVLCGLLLSTFAIQAKRDSCTLKAILCASRAIQNISSEILGKVCTIEDLTVDIHVTTTEILEKVCDILDTVTAGFACSATPISMPITITEPGPYCLSQSITGEIVIATNRVLLDLNGHTVFGTISSDSQEDVIVQNGFVGSANPGGIVLANCMKAEIRNVFFSTSETGISLVTCEGVVLKECMFDSQTSFGVTTSFSSNITLQDLKATQCGVAFSVLGGDSINFINCDATSSEGDGFFISDVEGIKLIDCLSNHNASEGYLLLLTVTAQVEMNSCIAVGNADDGIQVFGSSGGGGNVRILSCFSSRNRGGLGIADGIRIDMVSDATQSTEINSCLASDNDANGIRISGSPTSNFTIINCRANNNSANGIISVGGGGGDGEGVIIGNETMSNGATGIIILGAGFAFNNYSNGNASNYSGVVAGTIIAPGVVTTSTGFWSNVGT